MSSQDRYPHSSAMSGDSAVLLAQLASGGDDIEVIDYSGGDVTPTLDNCRFLTTTAGTVIKADVFTKTGGLQTGLLLPATRILPISNIRKIYQTGTDAINIILWR